jgi:hypothetical protein
LSAELTVGGGGQFDVVADGEVIASRGGGFLTRFLGGGWPDENAVIAALRTKMGGS